MEKTDKSSNKKEKNLINLDKKQSLSSKKDRQSLRAKSKDKQDRPINFGAQFNNQNVDAQTYQRSGGHQQTQDLPPPQACPCFANISMPVPQMNNDLWDLQFSRWWGWNWVKKREALNNQKNDRSNVPPELTTCQCDPRAAYQFNSAAYQYNPTTYQHDGTKSDRKNGAQPEATRKNNFQDDKKRNKARRFRNLFTLCKYHSGKRQKGAKNKLEPEKKRHMQKMFDTPCSSVEFSTDPGKKREGRVTLNGNVECKYNSSSSKCSSAGSQRQGIGRACKCTTRRNECWVMEKSESSSSEEFHHRVSVNRCTSDSSTEESLDYLGLRMQNLQMDGEECCPCVRNRTMMRCHCCPCEQMFACPCHGVQKTPKKKKCSCRHTETQTSKKYTDKEVTEKATTVRQRSKCVETQTKHKHKKSKAYNACCCCCRKQKKSANMCLCSNYRTFCCPCACNCRKIGLKQSHSDTCVGRPDQAKSKDQKSVVKSTSNNSVAKLENKAPETTKPGGERPEKADAMNPKTTCANIQGDQFLSPLSGCGYNLKCPALGVPKYPFTSCKLPDTIDKDAILNPLHFFGSAGKEQNANATTCTKTQGDANSCSMSGCGYNTKSAYRGCNDLLNANATTGTKIQDEQILSPYCYNLKSPLVDFLNYPFASSKLPNAFDRDAILNQLRFPECADQEHKDLLMEVYETLHQTQPRLKSDTLQFLRPPADLSWANEADVSSVPSIHFLQEDVDDEGALRSANQPPANKLISDVSENDGDDNESETKRGAKQGKFKNLFSCAACKKPKIKETLAKEMNNANVPLDVDEKAPSSTRNIGSVLLAIQSERQSTDAIEKLKCSVKTTLTNLALNKTEELFGGLDFYGAKSNASASILTADPKRSEKLMSFIATAETKAKTASNILASLTDSERLNKWKKIARKASTPSETETNFWARKRRLLENARKLRKQKRWR